MRCIWYPGQSFASGGSARIVCREAAAVFCRAQRQPNLARHRCCQSLSRYRPHGYPGASHTLSFVGYFLGSSPDTPKTNCRIVPARRSVSFSVYLDRSSESTLQIRRGNRSVFPGYVVIALDNFPFYGSLLPDRNHVTFCRYACLRPPAGGNDVRNGERGAA